MKEQAVIVYCKCPSTGRTQDIVDCPCGYRNVFYRWSWAGNGKARCKGCQRWISYQKLEVFR